MEILKTLTGQPLDVVFCCVGGGGLLAGVSAYIKRVRPSVLLIGVEMDDAAGMTTSLAAGKVRAAPDGAGWGRVGLGDATALGLRTHLGHLSPPSPDRW